MASDPTATGGDKVATAVEEELPTGAYAIDGEYIWDSWVISSESSQHMIRYGLTASKDECKNNSNNRHDYAKVRCASSDDCGDHWNDEGVVLKPREDSEWPNFVIWTCQTMILNNTWVMWITGRNRPMDSQKIGRVVSEDPKAVWDSSKIEIVLDGTTEEAKSKGYDVTNADGVVAAFRDPMVLQSSDGKLHMVFASKHRVQQDSKEYLLPTVGYATSTDQDGKSGTWEFQTPIELPHYKDRDLEEYKLPHVTTASDTLSVVRQIEVPYVIRRKDTKGKEYTYLFISTQHNPDGKTNREKLAAFRGYVSKNGMDGPFNAVYEHVNPDEREFSNEPDKIYGDALYAPTVCEVPGKDGKVEYFASTFYSEDTKWPLSWTPLYRVTWNDKLSPPVPQFQFPNPNDILKSNL